MSRNLEQEEIFEQLPYRQGRFLRSTVVHCRGGLVEDWGDGQILGRGLNGAKDGRTPP